MNAARRRPRLFLDHKPPLVAFTVVAIVCALMMVHMARSEAAPGWLRAGLGGVVGQRVLEATILEADREARPATEAAAPLVGPAHVPAATGSGASSAGNARPVDGSQPVGVVVGVVTPGAGSSDPSHGAGSGDALGGDDESTGPGHGQGKGHGRGLGRDDEPIADVPVPGASASGSRGHHGHGSWREDWVGDRGEGHAKSHGDHPGKGHGNGYGNGHGNGHRDHHGQGAGEHHGHGSQGHGGHGHGHRR